MPREHPFDATNPTIWQRLIYFLTPFDERYEDLKNGTIALNVLRDLSAGLIVAMVAIPLAMGFAMASGLRPEQGIVGGALAAIIGALFGGSKYQVYGPTAAFIPIIAMMVHQHGTSFMILASLCAGLILVLMGLFRLGRFVRLVPDSIVVGFTIGIAVVIVASQLIQIFGINSPFEGHSALEKFQHTWDYRHEINGYSLLLALGTFALCKGFVRLSVYVPGPLIAIGIGTAVASTCWADRGIVSLRDEYGRIATDFWVVTPPAAMQFDLSFLWSLGYAAAAIVFVSAVESLLCSRMADRLAENQGTPFNPNKELWGQGWVNVFIPMLNGFPHTGALARTATNIKVGALSPLAGIFKCVFKLGMAAYLASFLERVPMACIGGIMMYVAYNMIKPAEVRLIVSQGRFQTAFMSYAAVMVVATDFVMGVGSALLLYAVALRIPGLAPTLRPSVSQATHPPSMLDRDKRAA